MRGGLYWSGFEGTSCCHHDLGGAIFSVACCAIGFGVHSRFERAHLYMWGTGPSVKALY